MAKSVHLKTSNLQPNINPTLDLDSHVFYNKTAGDSKPTTYAALDREIKAAESGFSAKEVVVNNPYITKSYLKEIEQITSKAVTTEQVSLLKQALQKEEFVKLDKATIEMHRRNFNAIRDDLRTQWEQNTGQTWPTYEQAIGSKKVGDPVDAHHIIPVNHNGPNTWWNIHPSHMKEHSKIHSKGSGFRTIFNSKKSTKE